MISLTNVACTIHSIVTHFGIIFSPRTVKEGDMAISFFAGPRIGASGENVSPPTTGHLKSQKWPGVSVGKKMFPIFFLNEATAGTPRHVCP